MSNAFINQISKGCKVTIVGLTLSAATCVSGSLFTQQTEVRTFAGVVGGVSGMLAMLNWQSFSNVGKNSWDNLQDNLLLSHNVKLVACTAAGLCATITPNNDQPVNKALNLWFLGSAATIGLTSLQTAKTRDQIAALADIEYEDGFDETLNAPKQIVEEPQKQLPVSSAQTIYTDRPTQPIAQAIPIYPDRPIEVVEQQAPSRVDNYPDEAISDAREDLLKAEILSTLESFKIKNTKWIGRIDGPTFIRCLLEPAPGVAVASITRRAEDLGRVLRLDKPPIISIDLGAIAIDIPRPDRQFVMFSSYFPDTPTPQNLGGLWIAIGVDLAGNLVEINLADPSSPHVLAGGTTGGGKSVLIRTVVASVIWRYTPEQVRIYLCDTGQVTFIDFEHTPWVEKVVKSTAEGLLVLGELESEMDRRNKLFPSVKAQDIDEYNAKTGANLPHILFVFEEYADFTSDKDLKSQTEEKLQRLSQLARKSGIHIFIATQRPSAKVITPEIRSNCPARIALKTASTADSKIVFGNDCEDAYYLLGKGDMLYNGQRLQSLSFDLGSTLEQYQVIPVIKQTEDPFLKYFSGKVEFVADKNQRFENFRHILPTHPGCYLVATADYKALYVGQAENIERRWNRTGNKEHHWIPAILELINKRERIFIYYLVCGDRQNKERDFTELLKPAWNSKGVGIEIKKIKAGEINYQPAIVDVPDSDVERVPTPEDFTPPPPGEVTDELKQVIVSCKRAGWSQNKTLQELYPNIAKSSGGTYQKLVQIYQQTLKESNLL